MKMDNPRKRYFCDAEFKNLVDSMFNLIKECRFTPFELRQALVLALTMYEETKARPDFLLGGFWEVKK